MIIYLKNANFTTSNIGKIDSYRVICTLGVGATYTGPTIISKDNSGFSAKIVIDEGYVVKAANIVVTVDGTAVTPTITGNEISINVTTKVAGDIIIKVPTSVAGAPTYTVTYQINGHGTQPAAVSEVTALPDTLPTLSESGWTFNGWYKDSAFTVAAVAGTTISANTTLYAKWTEVVIPEVDPNTCEHTFGTDNKCTKCGMPNYTKVTIVKNEGIRSITVTKIDGWGTIGQTIADGTDVNIGDRLQVDVVPEDGYILVGVESPYTTTAFSGGCTIAPTAMIFEDVTYEFVEPADTTTGIDYFLGTSANRTGPHTTWMYYIYDVTPGRKYHIEGIAGQAARLWLMFSGEEITKTNIINYSSDSSAAAAKEEYVVAPAGAVKMVVNTRNDNGRVPFVEVHPTYGV